MAEEIATKRRAALWGGVALLLIAAMTGWYFLPLKEWIQQLNTWIQGLGGWGFLVFAIAYVVAVLVLAPASVFTIAAGFVFGAWAFPLVVAAATVGATLAFLVSRYFVREKVKLMLEDRPTFQAVDKAVGEEGWKIVALLRLIPTVMMIDRRVPNLSFRWR